MPNYDYKCTVCGKLFNAKNSIIDMAHSVCPSCSGIGDKQFSMPKYIIIPNGVNKRVF